MSANYTPLEVFGSNLAVWVESSRLPGYSLTTLGNCVRWADKSGHGNDLIGASPNGPRAYQGGAGRSLSFNDPNNPLSGSLDTASGLPVIAQPVLWCCVYQPRNVGGITQFIMGSSTNVSGAQFIAISGGTQWQMFAGNNVFGSPVDINPAQPCLVTALFNGASSLLRVNRRVIIANQDAGSQHAEGARLGAVIGGGASTNGFVRSLCVVSGAPTDAQIERIETYFLNSEMGGVAGARSNADRMKARVQKLRRGELIG